MVVGIVLIFLLQWMFLGNLRSAVIVGATIPFALFFAVGILVLRGEFGESSVGRRDRFRPDRRCDGHHGRKHLPLAERPRKPAARPRRRSGRCRRRAARQEACDFPCRGRGEPLDLLRGRHHHRRLHSAVHAERRRGPHLRPDGADLCLCARRRPDRHLHRHARAERADLCPSMCKRPKRWWCACCTASTCRCCTSRSASKADHPERRAGVARGRRLRGAPAGAGVPAQARGGQSLDPRDAAVDDLAGGGQRLRQSDAPD